MSEDIAIKVENLTKIYKLYNSPMDRLKESLHPFRRKYHKDFYALNNVSFEIRKGETVGIIGKNGSGKSTLLKILTGVLTPSNGKVMVNGKVSALLELGAGFNPELTGIENIYFSGTLMGYPREDMDARLADILSFADIGEFIHQPVKMYSSGMFVRLAFAVSINVNPELLIVDEALSVGDEAFQRKCFAKIIKFQQEGKTILFVSHSAAVITELCNRCILFDQGEQLLSLEPKPVISAYQRLVYAPPEKMQQVRRQIVDSKMGVYSDVTDEVSDDVVEQLDCFSKPVSTVSYESRGALISDPKITTLDGREVNVLRRGQEYNYGYTVTFTKSAQKVRCGMLIKTVSGLELGGLTSHSLTGGIDQVEAGTVMRQLFMFKCNFLPGTYFLNSGLVGEVDGEQVFLHRVLDVMMFRVHDEPGLVQHGLVDISPSDKFCSIQEMVKL